MSNLEMKVDAILRMCTTEDPKEAAAIRQDLRKLTRSGGFGKTGPFDPENVVREILLDMGTPEHLIGHPYAVRAILLCFDDRTYLDNLTYGLYPALATQFGTTPSRCERAIRHMIEVTWTRGNLEAMNRYFGNTINPEKGKPTNGEFIARLVNVVKLRKRQESMEN